MAQQRTVDSEAVRPSVAAPRALREYRDLHRDGTIVVCGCGVSLSQLDRPEDFITIGVNDVGRLFQPDYLVVLNPRNQFVGDRFQHVEHSQASAVFTQLNLGISHPNVVRFRLGRRGGVDVTDQDSLPYTRNSPYVAACLAMYMGAKRIGLIGVDFTRDHFFGKTGTHSLAREFPTIDLEYKRLSDACEAQGIEIFNLSEISRLTALRKISIQDFGTASVKRKSLAVVSYSVTPVAGVPIILSQCIAARTAHSCRTVWATNNYGNGVCFDSDVEWRSASAKAEELLTAADVVVVHNGKVDPRHKTLLADKPVITMAHNYMWNVDTTYVDRGMPGVVVGQYQATLPEFRDWHVVPNPVPIWESRFQRGAKNPELTICYTPSGKHEKYPQTHRLYWHSKGYATTMRVLEALARRHAIRLETIGGAQVSHAHSMAMKQRSHIVIDECVTGSYHRNSLEGLAAGCVVLNGLGRLPAVRDVFCRCSGTEEAPFVYASLETLEEVLEGLVQKGSADLVELGEQNRRWLERYWIFEEQWDRFWEPVVDIALEKARSNSFSRNVNRTESEPHRIETQRVESTQSCLSVVVCHGGRDRLSQLGTCLASLRQSSAVGEIILVDMGVEPFAQEIGRRWADGYFFVRNDGLFERARCLNIGSALAGGDLILWLDSDLLMQPNFLQNAVAEIERRKLDFLVPFSQVNYLTAADSQDVQCGTRDPVDCRAETVLRTAYGGAGIVRNSFLKEHGGLCEGFRGWGGEDDAWWHKAKLLGKAGLTEQRNQTVYHLHHPNAESFERKKEANPHYAENLALLREIWSAKTRDDFAHNFPASGTGSWNWQSKHAFIVGDQYDDGLSAAAVANALSSFTGIGAVAKSFGPGESIAAASDVDAFDALIILDSDIAAELIATEAFRSASKRTIVLQNGGRVLPEKGEALKNAAAVLCTEAKAGYARSEADLSHWTLGRNRTRLGNEQHIARGLLQPLSLLIGHAPNLEVNKIQAPEWQIAVPEPKVDVPVWMYWEGKCPEWIRLCQETAMRSTRDVRLLSADDFRALRHSDIDIDLEPLHVAQRADFVRAHLLARFGGLWLDSDCLVMQPLDSLLQPLQHYDFIGHRERTANLWANDLMAAALNSKVAALLYSKICQTLRSRKRIGWTDIGCQAVTQAIHAQVAPCLELKVNKVQPVCWSEHAPFLKVRTDAEHEKAFDESAICYMLSNLTMQKALNTTDISSHLLREGTFFRYLLNRSESAAKSIDTAGSTLRLRSAHGRIGFTQPATSIFSSMTADAVKTHAESLSGPGSSLQQTIQIRQLLPLMLQDLNVRTMLDAGCGDYHWMRTLDLRLANYIGADLLPELTEKSQNRFGTATTEFVTLDIARDPLPNVDLILCRDCLVLLSFDDIFRTIQNFRNSGARYLLATHFPDHSENTETRPGTWRPLNLQNPPFNFPAPHRILNEKCDESKGRFADKCLALWNVADLPDLNASAHSVVSVSLSEALSKPTIVQDTTEVQAGSYELAVVVPISIAGKQRDRLRNLQACLGALNSQDLDRSRYCIVVVEQDSEPRVDDICSRLADRYVFARNPNAFNKSWAFNVGAQAVEAGTALCLMDSDMLPDRSFLRAGLEQIQTGHRAVRPYARVTYLDDQKTEQAIARRLRESDRVFECSDFPGPSFPNAKGGCLFVDPSLFAEIRGLDERFRGFGYEDTEFWDRIARRTEIGRLPGTLLHMNHARTVRGGGANGRIYREISTGKLPRWNGPMGDLNKYAHEPPHSPGESAVRTDSSSRLSKLSPHSDSADRNMVQVFTRMMRYCQSAGIESLSGPGSCLRQTEQIRRLIPELLRELGATSLLDCGCGDFHWMKGVDLGSVKYVGVELLDELTVRNRKEHGSQQRTFRTVNMVSHSLPAADIIVCRDAMVHLPFETVRKSLCNFKSSRSTYLLMTHFTRTTANRDIATGQWRPVNFQLPPFSFPEPLKVIDEKCTEGDGAFADKTLALWRLEELSL